MNKQVNSKIVIEYLEVLISMYTSINACWNWKALTKFSL